ncbi:hypothetical protein ACTA71_007835 [Dictyostelium dimigraforme]
MNNNNRILKLITSNIKRQIINNNKVLNRSLYLNTKKTSSTITVPLNSNSFNNNIIRNFSNRRYPHDNKGNSDDNGGLNFLPTINNQNSIIERISLTLVAFGSVGLLIYVFFDGAEEMVINNLIFKKTVDTLRSNEKVQEVFGEDFTAKGLGFRSNGSFNYKHTYDKNGDKIVFINFMIESERGKIGVVECKALRNSTFGLEIKVLKVKYENYKNITVVDQVLPKKFNDKLKNFLSIFGINLNKNQDSGSNSGSSK